MTPNNLNIDTNTLYVDAANNRVGVGTNLPTNALEVTGTFRVNGGLDAAGFRQVIAEARAAQTR